MTLAPERLATKTIRRSDDALTRVAVDLCVVGAGAAGMSAALEAAKLGASVALVDAGTALGGQSVGSLIGTFCGFYANGPSPRQVTHGIADAILADLGASGDISDIDKRRNTRIVLYRVNALARWYERAVHAAKLKIALGAVVRRVRRDGKRIAGLDIATRYGDLALDAKAFVDATGDANLAWLAGADCRMPEAPIYGTTMFTLEGASEGYDREAIVAALEKKADAWGLRRRDGFVFTSAGTGETLVNMTHMQTPLDPFAATDAMLDGREQVDRTLEFFKAEFPAHFKDARVKTYGLPGVRQTRWIKGAHHLTADEVRGGTRFADSVARCSWPIELHDRPDGVHWEVFGDDHMHYVPFRSMVAPGLDNLVAAGRNVDGDPAALSSIRVMGPCIAMGAAAAHALDLAGSGSVHQIDIGALQKRLAVNLD
jgi:2-polyprenyl-6-methoxyphenol hydroxylase-like FAD-dependent oxidoreductase